MWKGISLEDGQGEKAIYIDAVYEDEDKVEVRDGDSDGISVTSSQWAYLPDVLLEDIFSYLTIRERYYASLVCSNWARVFNSQQVWRTFILDDYTLTRRKFNYYMGYQYVLDHLRTQVCLKTIGSFIRHLVIQPMTNFFNLYEFMNMVSFMEERNPGCIGRIHSLKFTFACHLAQRTEQLVFGTGGPLLEALKRLMWNLASLKELELNDLLLEREEGLHLLDEVAFMACERLLRLRVTNATRPYCPLLHAGIFIALRDLTLSPISLDQDLILLLGGTHLEEFTIIQDEHSESAPAVPSKAWKECRKGNPRLRVHLLLRGPTRTDLTWQPGAPVTSIIYDTPYSQLGTGAAVTAVDLYSDSLEVFGHLRLPRFHAPRPFVDRGDSHLMLLARRCPHLHTFLIRERVSTSTLLLLAHTARSLKRMYVRRQAVILRSDWPQQNDWSSEFAMWLKHSAQSYQITEEELGGLLNHCSWRMLSDQQFKQIHINPKQRP